MPFPKLSCRTCSWTTAGGLNNLRLRSARGWAGSQPGIVNAYSQYVTYANLAFRRTTGFVNAEVFGNPKPA